METTTVRALMGGLIGPIETGFHPDVAEEREVVFDLSELLLASSQLSRTTTWAFLLMVGMFIHPVSV